MLDTQKILLVIFNIMILIILTLSIKVNAMVIVSIKPIGFITVAITDGIIPLEVILLFMTLIVTLKNIMIYHH